MQDLKQFSDEQIISIVSQDAETELRNRGYEFGWYKKENYVGAIYILVNPAFPDLVKIGYTSDLDKRLKSLNQKSAVPDPYHCYAVYQVKKGLEDLKLHDLIDSLDPSLRHSSNREFYEMSAQKAFNILSAIAQITGTEDLLKRNPYSDSFFNEPETAMKKHLTFDALGIPIGSTLTFAKDQTVTCTTVNGDTTVEYDGQEYTLSGLAKKLLNRRTAQGSNYFEYNGVRLKKILPK